jgi:hypothetical protein
MSAQPGTTVLRLRRLVIHRTRYFEGHGGVLGDPAHDRAPLPNQKLKPTKLLFR